MKRKKRADRVAIWMPMPMAMPNPGEVVDHIVKLCTVADRHRVGQWMPVDRTGQLDYGRTHACISALALGYSHILMLDADHIHKPHDLVERLLAHGKDVVGSLNYARGDGRACMIPKYADEHPDDMGAGLGLVQCSAIGTGSLMIRLEAIKDWPQPWFYMPYDQTNLSTDHWPGEDGGFSLNCQKYGVEIWCDTELNSPHATTTWI